MIHILCQIGSGSKWEFRISRKEMQSTSKLSLPVGEHIRSNVFETSRPTHFVSTWSGTWCFVERWACPEGMGGENLNSTKEDISLRAKLRKECIWRGFLFSIEHTTLLTKAIGIEMKSHHKIIFINSFPCAVTYSLEEGRGTNQLTTQSIEEKSFAFTTYKSLHKLTVQYSKIYRGSSSKPRDHLYEESLCRCITSEDSRLQYITSSTRRTFGEQAADSPCFSTTELLFSKVGSNYVGILLIPNSSCWQSQRSAATIITIIQKEIK